MGHYSYCRQPSCIASSELRLFSCEESRVNFATERFSYQTRDCDDDDWSRENWRELFIILTGQSFPEYFSLLLIG